MSMQVIRRIIAIGAIFFLVSIVCHKLLYGRFLFKDVYKYYENPKKHEHFQVFRNEQAKAYYVSGFSQPSPQICVDLGLNFQLLVIVESPPNHRKERNRIRKTWGKNKNTFAIGFIMGQTDNEYTNHSLITESTSFSDLIITNFKDDIKNQTFIAIAMMQWVTEYCPKVNFLLKVDDHMYVNMPRLFHFMNNTDEEENAIYGELRQLAEPDRQRSSIYFVPKEEYDWPFYPDYISRASYVLPAYLAPILYDASLNCKFLGIGDIFMTGLVAQAVFTKRINAPAFSNMKAFGKGGPCSVYWVISSDVEKFLKQLSICDKSWRIKH